MISRADLPQVKESKDAESHSAHSSADAQLPATRRERDISPASLRVDSQSFTTRTLTVFEAVGGPLNRKYYYCRSKFPLAPVERVQFSERMERLTALPLPALKVRNFGIDEVGFAYIITEQGNTKSLITKAPRPPEQVSQIVEEVIDILSTVHEAGIVIGDVSHDTFRLDSQNRVVLTGSLGIRPPTQTLESLGPEWIFLSPEEARGNKPSSSGDVFSVMALVYRLLTGRHYSTAPRPRVLSEQDFARIAKPSTVPHLVPEWADEFIATCLLHGEKDRPKDGAELKETFLKQAFPKPKFTVSLERLYTAMLGVRTEAIRAAGFFVSFVTFALVAIWLKQEGLLPQINLSAAAPKISPGSVDLRQAKNSTEDVLGKLTGGVNNFGDRLAAAALIKTQDFDLNPLGGIGDKTVDYIEKLRREAARNEQSAANTESDTDTRSFDASKAVFHLKNTAESPLLMTFDQDTGWWEAVAFGLLYTWDIPPADDSEIACQS